MSSIELTPSREARVGEQTVYRALPQRLRRTVGAWCFLDHMRPTDVADGDHASIGPHPHIGLQTVTWLLDGQLVHYDSLGSEQPIRPGQLNLMTAGHGVVHAEEAPRTYRGQFHGAQLWVAQPEATRNGPPAFESHPELPQLELGTGTATVLVGAFDGAVSPARRDTDHVGVELALRDGPVTLGLRRDYEYALVVLAGALGVDETPISPHQLAYLGRDRDELTVTARASTRALLLGGVPFRERVSMWWNYVARSHDEIDTADAQWRSGHERFGPVSSRYERIMPPAPPWRAARSEPRPG